MPAPIALQLYTLREQLARNFKNVVTRVAEMGYVGVEPAGFAGTTADEASNLFADLGLEVCSIHTHLPVGKQKNEVIELAKELEVRRIISSTPRDAFVTTDGVKALCDRWNQAHEVVIEHDLELGLHNHYWEFGQVEGRSGFDLLIEHLNPGIFFQVDTYWVNTGGGDSVAVIEKLGERAPLLHIKDGPCDPQADMMAIGSGKMDFPPIIQAAQGTAEWLIVELDRCATDMVEAVQASYRYLVGNGLARGAR
jgi:sugar phosphate isomerase/epimerase